MSQTGTVTITGTKNEFMKLAMEEVVIVAEKVGQYFVDKIKNIDIKNDQIAQQRLDSYRQQAEKAWNFSVDMNLSDEERSMWYDRWETIDGKLNEYEEQYRKGKRQEKALAIAGLSFTAIVSITITAILKNRK